MALKWRFNPFRRLVVYFDYFTYCYRENWDGFAAFYFFARFIFQTIETFCRVTPLISTIKCLLCIVVCIVFAFVKPYHDPLMNYFDCFALAILTIISLLSIVMEGFTYQKQVIFSYVINCLALLPFVFVASKLLFVYLPKILRFLKGWASGRYASWKNRAGKYCTF